MKFFIFTVTIFSFLINFDESLATTRWKDVTTCSAVVSWTDPNKKYSCITKTYFYESKKWNLILTDTFFSSSDKTGTIYYISM